MNFRRHSPVSQSAYHDLLQSLMDEAVLEIKGAPSLVERGGKRYWYDSYRIGTQVRKRYIGEDSADLRQRLDRHASLKAAAKERLQSRTRLVRLLRAEGFSSLDSGTASLVAALAKAGVFRLGGTIVGTTAFRLYEAELGVKFRLDETAQTADLDIASFERLSLALDDQIEPSMGVILGEFAFEPVPSLNRGPAWRWRRNSGETLVEFLTPAFGEEEQRPLAALGVTAQSLHHLNYLIAEPIQAVVIYRSGLLVQIPRPERFAIHKLIVADRRKGTDRRKSEKDRRQAAFLISVLSEDRPEELSEAYQNALARGPKWRERIGRSLEKMPETLKMLG